MKSFNINRKLTVSYIIIILGTVLTISIIISIIFSTQLTESSKKQLNLRISKISKEIEDQLLNVIKITEEVSENHEILHSLNTAGAGRNVAYMKELRSKITSTERRTPLIERVILINHNLEILDPVYARSLYSSAILGDDDFTEFLQKKYFFYFAKPGTFPIDYKKGEKRNNLTIALYQRLLDENYWLMGYQIAVLNRQMLFSSIWNSDRDQFFSGIYIFNERNELLFKNGKDFSPEKISSNLDFSKLTGNISLNAVVDSQKCLILVKLLPSVNWFVTGIIPYSAILKNLNIALKLIFLIGILFTLVTGIIGFLIARTITKPILKITSAMHSYEQTGSLETIHIKTSGELKYMGEVYNKLVLQINSFIANIYKEQEEKHAAEIKSIKYELDFLQAQINPHFIHNTLNAIGYQAEKDGNKLVFESLKSFNILLRAAISGTESLITVKQELILIENFIQIQRLRYGTTFKIFYRVDPDVEYEKVPKLILQPLVENAIFHGIEPSEREGSITITAKQEADHLILEVSDNGVGMNSSPETTRRKFNRIGLQNVDERIKILFGPHYGLTINSKEDKGTTARILLPLAEDEDV